MRALIALCVAAAACFAPHADARDVLTASDAYILEAPPSARSNVGYVTIANQSRHPVRLLAIDSDRFARLEMHSMRAEGGVLKMRNERTVEVPARGELRFEPGGYHLMLFGAEPPIRTGEKIELLLQSDSGDEVEITFQVRSQPGMEVAPVDPAPVEPAAPAAPAELAPVAPAAPAGN